MNAFKKSVGLLAATVAAPALAASDGTLGPTSTGTFNVSVAISPDSADNVRVYGLEDFSFSGSEGGLIDGQAKRFCIIRNTADGLGGPVNITISSFDAADPNFRVKTPGGAQAIQMTLGLFKLGQSGGLLQLFEGTPAEVEVHSTCTKGSNVDDYSLEIVLANPDTALAGNYSGSFLVTVAPN